jgi:putative DNA primase/helicase
VSEHFPTCAAGSDLPFGEERELPEAPLVVPAPEDPMAVARAFLEERYKREDDLLLRHHRGSFYRWTGTCWPEDEDQRVKSELYQWLEPALYYKAQALEPFRPNVRKVAEVAHALAAIGHVSEARNRPCWLDGTTTGEAGASGMSGVPSFIAQGADQSVGLAIDQTPDIPDVISMANGLLRLSTRIVEPHRPAFFNEHSLPFAFEPEAERPARWLRFLEELWGDDEESIECLAEVMGYVLSGETNQQKIVMLVGPMRSGKGTIGRVLTGLLGAHNVAAPTLAGLSQNFGLQVLIGKPLTLISDARLASKADSTVAVERLLSISGEDSLTIDRKYRDPWTGRLPSRFLILTNELPRFTDASGALASRFVILVLSESFLGRENPRLSDELLEEAPSIFNWALEGLDRLRTRGHFQQPRASVDAMRHLEDLASPVSAFVRDGCVVGPEQEILKDALWEVWKRWCEAEGMPHSTKAILIRDLRAAHPGIKPKRGSRDGDRVQVVAGIGLRP